MQFRLTHKKVGILLISLVLASSVFSVVIRSLIYEKYGRLTYTLIELVLYSILFTTISIKSSKFVYNKLDVPVYLYLYYGLFLLIWSILHKNGYYDIIVNFKIVIIPVILYFAIRYYESYDFLLVERIKHILFFIITIVVAEMYFEFFALKLFGFDLERLPWVSLIQGQRTLAESLRYNITSSAFRIVSIFSYVSSAAMISSVGFLIFFREYEITNRKTYRFMSFICFVGVLIASSRTFFCSLFLGVVYIGIFNRKIIKELILYLLISVIVFMVFLSNIYEHSSYVEWHLGGFESFFKTRHNNINFLAFPDGAIIKNMVYLIFGTGFGDIDTLNNIYESYTIYGLEFRLIGVVLFKYGIIYILIVGFLFFQIMKVKNYDRNIIYYKAILIQFAISLIHYTEMLKIGLFEMFITIYAITVIHIIKTKKSQIVRSSELQNKKIENKVDYGEKTNENTFNQCN